MSFALPDPPPSQDAIDRAKQQDLTSDFSGPQQSRKPAAGALNSQPPQVATFNPQMLLNPRGAAAQVGRAAGDSPQESGTHTLNGTSDAQNPGLGMANMIERMHNVQKRDTVGTTAAHKRKASLGEDDDEEVRQAKIKSSFNAPPRAGGTLTAHLKAEREKLAANSSGAINAAIDLTNDDDEVQIIGGTPVVNDHDDEICLGMTKAKATVNNLPHVSQRAQSAVPSTSWPRIKAEYRRAPADHNVIELYDRAGKRFGKLDANVSSALCPLLDNQNIHRTRVSIWVDSRPRTPEEVAGASVSIYLSVSIMIFARRSKSDYIGRCLSRKGLFLSDPFGAAASHRPYENPQLPKDYSPRHQGQGRSQGVSNMPSMTRTVEEMRREASSMIDSLAKHEDLPEKEADERYIVTPLLAHQKQGLHFLTEHERLDHETGFSLWKSSQKKNGGEVWYNVITSQTVAERPAPVQGGILADMMGLGKTLSILSLIASTRDEASQYSKLETKDSAERNVRATLIICPKSVMANWNEQIRAHTKPGTFKVYAYHGATRTQSTSELAKYDVVLTTFNTAAAEINGKNRALAAVNWFRIVLDEAHQIRNQNTQVSKACCALTAERRWAVTGTPVQNALNDLGALVKFLRIKPFDEGQAWAQFIIAPFRMANPDVIQHLRLLVDSITLRRVKDSIDLPERSEKRVRLRFSEEEQKLYARVAGDSNRQLRLMTGGSDKALKGRSYAHVLKSIGRMRMLCAHGLDMLNEDDRKEIAEGMDPDNAIAIDLGDEPARGTYQFVTERQAYETLHVMGDSEVNRCIKCDRKIGDNEERAGDSSSEDSDSDSSSDDEAVDDVIGHLTPCYHLVCPNCKDGHVETITPMLTDDERHECQYCEAYVRFGLFELRRSAFRNFIEARSAKAKNPKSRRWDESNYGGPSTKVHALLEELKNSIMESRALGPDEPPIRSVVFSGWTTYLSLIEIALEENGIGYVRLDGSMSIRARTAVLDRFKGDPDILVLLVSIKAGGQGLNFTTANKVYMMEPQFNPGVEQQAIDRVHRLGQKRAVFVTHYIMTDSVEEGILKLQRKKEELANLSLDRKMSAAEVQKQKLEDLKELFK